MATFFPVRVAGASGETHPSSKARSAISSSIALIVTGSSFRPSVHDPSHGAGQTRPVNSGKLFVWWRRTAASFQRPRKIRSFQSGIRLWIGQPEAIPEISFPV